MLTPTFKLGVMEFIIFAVVIVLLFLPSIMLGRKQRAQQMNVQEFQRNLEPGDKVITTSGIHGQLSEVCESTVDLEVAPGVVITLERVAILRFQDQPRDPYPVDEVPADTDADAALAAQENLAKDEPAQDGPLREDSSSHSDDESSKTD